MITQNAAFQVLVTAGNQGVAAAGLRPDQLLSGQLGVFDYNTGLSVDGSVPSKNRNVFIAVGIARGLAAASAVTDIRKSAGENVEKSGLRAMTQKPYVAGVDKEVVLDFGTLKANTSYTAKLEFRSQEAFRNFGNNTPVKSATLATGPAVNTDELYNAFVVAFGNELLLADEDEGIVSIAFLDGGAADAVIAEEDVADAVGKLKLQITVASSPLKTYTTINLNYLNPRATNFIVSTPDGFDSTASVTVTQELVFEEMSGYDVNQLEYVAGGWNGNPGVYRESSVGFAGVELFAVQATGYDVISLSYDNTGIGGGEKYHTSLETIIAIPAADNTTFTAVENLLNLVFRDIAGASTADEMAVETN